MACDGGLVAPVQFGVLKRLQLIQLQHDLLQFAKRHGPRLEIVSAGLSCRISAFEGT